MDCRQFYRFYNRRHSAPDYRSRLAAASLFVIGILAPTIETLFETRKAFRGKLPFSFLHGERRKSEKKYAVQFIQKLFSKIVFNRHSGELFGEPITRPTTRRLR